MESNDTDIDAIDGLRIPSKFPPQNERSLSSEADSEEYHGADHCNDFEWTRSESINLHSDDLQIRNKTPSLNKKDHGDADPVSISMLRPAVQSNQEKKAVISPSMNLVVDTSPSIRNTQPHQTGQLTNTFTLAERLGDGAFGSVWHGKSKIDSQSYAIKLIPFAQESEVFEDLAFREVRTMAKMDGNPFVVRYYTAWIERMQPFLYEKTKDILALQSEGEALPLMNVPSDAECEEKVGGIPKIEASFERSFRRSCSLARQEQISYNFDDEWSDIDAMDLGQSPSESRMKSAATINTEQKSEEPSEVLIIQMELCDSGTLRDWLLERKEVDYIQSLQILKQIVEALHHIHGYKVLHRDLKPENVFLSKRGGIKLGDFGLSMSSDERMMCDGCGGCDHSDEALTSGLGTPTYAAPEQLHAHEGKVSYSKPADIYPLGLITFELLNVFETGMERAIAFNVLKNTGRTTDAFRDKYNRMAYLIEAMVLKKAEDRPTTKDILDLLEVEWTEKRITSPRLGFMQLEEPTESTSETLTLPSNFRRASTHLLTPATGATATTSHSQMNSAASSPRGSINVLVPKTQKQMEMELMAKDEEIALLRERITMLEQREMDSPGSE